MAGTHVLATAIAHSETAQMTIALAQRQARSAEQLLDLWVARKAPVEVVVCLQASLDQLLAALRQLQDSHNQLHAAVNAYPQRAHGGHTSESVPIPDMIDR